MSPSRRDDELKEAEAYELLDDLDVDDDPPQHRPLGPGDVFLEVSLAHLATPFVGPVMVVGHPCSLRRGLELQADVPVAPILEPGIPSKEHPHAERVLPVRKLLPPGSSANRVVQLTQTTTIPAHRLDVGSRCASLSTTGIVALQQRVVGNQTRVKVPPGLIRKHCRGPLTEVELWTDWREGCIENGLSAYESLDDKFDAFMRTDSGFDHLTWREALGTHEHARARAVAAMELALEAALRDHPRASKGSGGR